MLEVLEPKIEDSEILTGDEAEGLRCAMQAKISEAVELGVFTSKEADEWEEGFEACDRLEYMENLIDIVDDFVISGLEVMKKITASLDTDLLTEQEKMMWQSQAKELSFQDKCELIEDLAVILHDVAQLKHQLTQLLNTKVISSERAQALEQQFNEVSASAKEGVITRAILVAAEVDLKSQTMATHIRALIAGQQFEAARKTLWLATINNLTSAERTNLSLEIDAAEIAQTRRLAQAA